MKCRAKGAGNGRWIGGRTVKGPYVLIYAPEHALARQDGYIMEHRLVAAQKWGEEAVKAKDVHHLDGDSANNRVENLELMEHGEHTAHHHEERRRAKREGANE